MAATDGDPVGLGREQKVTQNLNNNTVHTEPSSAPLVNGEPFSDSRVTAAVMWLTHDLTREAS